MGLANKIGTYVLPFKNSMVVCPPGQIRPGQGKLILVPTIMRSGTHVLIDTILNNFSQYRRRPLYVDLDRLLDEPEGRHERMESLLKGGAYVVKTHFPQVYSDPARAYFVRFIARHSYIITVTRNPDQTYWSTYRWGQAIAADKKKYMVSLQRFRQFWAEATRLDISFSELTDMVTYERVLGKIGNFIHVDINDGSRVIYPVPKKLRLKIYIMKALTRLLGKYSPVINTTIRFAASD